eukprot:6492370-Amphidinium_carterae.3
MPVQRARGRQRGVCHNSEVGDENGRFLSGVHVHASARGCAHMFVKSPAEAGLGVDKIVPRPLGLGFVHLPTVHVDDPIVAGRSEAIRMFFKLVGTERTQHGARRPKYFWEPTSVDST